MLTKVLDRDSLPVGRSSVSGAISGLAATPGLYSELPYADHCRQRRFYSWHWRGNRPELGLQEAFPGR